MLLNLLAKARVWYAEHPDEAKALVGNMHVQDIHVQENAAWVAALRALINLDEFITRE